MKYSIAFGFFAVIFVYWGFISNGFGYILFWFAFDCIVLSAGYARLGAAVFQKKPNGKIPVFVKLAFLPYILFTLLVWHIYKIIGGEQAYNEITEDIIIGRRLLAKEIPCGIQNYVDLTAEMEDPAETRGLNYICLPILDADIPKDDDLEKAISKLHNGKTYIHCAQGHGRTGVFALAVLTNLGIINSFEEGLDKLKNIRPGIGLNKRQKKFVQKYIKDHPAASC